MLAFFLENFGHRKACVSIKPPIIVAGMRQYIVVEHCPLNVICGWFTAKLLREVSHVFLPAFLCRKKLFVRAVFDRPLFF